MELLWSAAPCVAQVGIAALLKRGRRPPQLPEAFSAEIMSKKFTNNADVEAVIKMHARVATQVLGGVDCTSPHLASHLASPHLASTHLTLPLTSPHLPHPRCSAASKAFQSCMSVCGDGIGIPDIDRRAAVRRTGTSDRRT